MLHGHPGPCCYFLSLPDASVESYVRGLVSCRVSPESLLLWVGGRCGSMPQVPSASSRRAGAASTLRSMSVRTARMGSVPSERRRRRRLAAEGGSLAKDCRSPRRPPHPRRPPRPPSRCSSPACHSAGPIFDRLLWAQLLSAAMIDCPPLVTSANCPALAQAAFLQLRAPQLVSFQLASLNLQASMANHPRARTSGAKTEAMRSSASPRSFVVDVEAHLHHSMNSSKQLPLESASSLSPPCCLHKCRSRPFLHSCCPRTSRCSSSPRIGRRGLQCCV